MHNFTNQFQWLTGIVQPLSEGVSGHQLFGGVGPLVANACRQPVPSWARTCERWRRNLLLCAVRFVTVRKSDVKFPSPTSLARCDHGTILLCVSHDFLKFCNKRTSDLYKKKPIMTVVKSTQSAFCLGKCIRNTLLLSNIKVEAGLSLQRKLTFDLINA